jgi:hypothetical protein
MSEKDLMLDVDQAGELKRAFRRHGWTNKDIKTLSERNILGEVLKVIRKQAEIKWIDHLIDCDANPFVPPGWSVEEHKKGGFFKFDPAKIFLYLSKEEKANINGNDLRKELANKPSLNANVLDYLLAHPEIIPKKWKDKFIFFFGTIYRDKFGDLYVRYLRWWESGWCDRCNWLGINFDACKFSAVAS